MGKHSEQGPKINLATPILRLIPPFSFLYLSTGGSGKGGTLRTAVFLHLPRLRAGARLGISGGQGKEEVPPGAEDWKRERERRRCFCRQEVFSGFVILSAPGSNRHQASLCSLPTTWNEKCLNSHLDWARKLCWVFCTGNTLTRMLRVDFLAGKVFQLAALADPPRHPPPVSFFRLRPLFFRPFPSVPHFSSGREKPGEGGGEKIKKREERFRTTTEKGRRGKEAEKFD